MQETTDLTDSTGWDFNWRPVIPDGWEDCEVCGLLIRLGEERLCAYCRREADFESIYRHQPPFETHGANEEPHPVHREPSQFTGQRHFFRPKRATAISWFAAQSMGGEGHLESGIAWGKMGRTITHRWGYESSGAGGDKYVGRNWGRYKMPKWMADRARASAHSRWGKK